MSKPRKRILSAALLVLMASLSVFVVNQHFRLGRNIIFRSADVDTFVLPSGDVLSTNRWYTRENTPGLSSGLFLMTRGADFPGDYLGQAGYPMDQFADVLNNSSGNGKLLVVGGSSHTNLQSVQTKKWTEYTVTVDPLPALDVWSN